MMFVKFLAPLLLAVATNGQSRCRLEDSCAAGLTIVELDICAFTDEDLNDIAACFDNVGRSNIEYLNLRRNDLVNIPVGFFDGFDALAELDLDFNEVIPQAGTFRGLNALDSLILTRNRLANLVPGFFEGLDSLRALNLFGNAMELAVGDFIQATSLEVLIFNDTFSESLPSGVFEGLDSLLELDISDNRFTTLPVDIFDDVPNLQILDISDNSISSLPDGIFGNLPNLVNLKFARNGFVIWPAGLLNGLTSLKTLSLSGHRMTALEAGSFEGTPALEVLDLSSNEFSDLPAGTFDGIAGTLIQLDLGFNGLTAIPVDIFDAFPSLKTLNIIANDLTLQASDFDAASSLEELDMSSSISNDLPAGVFDGLTSLRSLDISFNGPINLLADHFKGASLLESLYIQDIGLSTLPTGLFDDLASLTWLSLSSNSMTTLEAGTFGGTPNLEILNLRFNDLTMVPANVFNGLASLQELSINNNQFASLPTDTFEGLVSLVELYLDDNALTTLPAGLFDGLGSLQKLDMDDNMLTTLPADIFDGLVSLLELHMDDNQLSTLPAGLFDGVDALQELDLDDNDDLQCLPATEAKTVTLPDTFDETATCGCPNDPVCDDDGGVCECQPGINGFSCVGSSAGVTRALSCPASADCTSDGQCADDEVCCPTSQTCEPLLGGMTSACGDPHMTGFRGQKFDFTGKDAGWYALISDLPSFHVNMRVTAPVPELPQITYITGISLITVDEDGIEHSIALSVNNPHTLDSTCPPRMSDCLAEGALTVVIDGGSVLAAPGTATAGPGVEVSAVNLPGACRSFGFEKYWERNMLEKVRVGQGERFESQNMAEVIAEAPSSSRSQAMGEWILGDPTATNMMECAAYVAESMHTDGGVFAHQSEHASFKISTPIATVRVSHGRLHQVAMRDPTDQFDLPDHLTWQMNLAVDLHVVSRLAGGVLGETFVPTVDADGNAIMNGMEAIRGTHESYRVAGPFDADFAGSTNRT